MIVIDNIIARICICINELPIYSIRLSADKNTCYFKTTFRNINRLISWIWNINISIILKSCSITLYNSFKTCNTIIDIVLQSNATSSSWYLICPTVPGIIGIPSGCCCLPSINLSSISLCGSIVKVNNWQRICYFRDIYFVISWTYYRVRVIFKRIIFLIIILLC